MTTVSVILVNYRGADDTIECAHHLMSCEYPKEDMEVVIVDNDSGDGSATRIRQAAPSAKVIESGSNLGFAGGCNFGVRHSNGDIVAFLNNDARPHSRWIAEAVSALEADRTIGCIASKVLDWEGTTVDYVNASLTWYGMGYKPEAGEKDTGQYEASHNVLFPTGAAMFTPRRLFDELGGFDERFFMFYEDVDFGWRVNLAGYDVRYLPSSVAYHRHHASISQFGNFRERYLLERNALMCLYKNLGSSLLDRLFAPALALSIERATSQAEADDGTTAVSAKAASNVSKIALTAPYAFAYLIENLPGLMESRRAIQESRQRSDEELISLFRNAMEPAYPLPRYLKLFGELDEFFGIRNSLQLRENVLVVTGDPISDKVAGPGIRAWEMARRLSTEHTVRLCSLGQVGEVHPRGFTVVEGNERTLRKHTDWADIIIFQGFLLELAPWLRGSDKVVVADIYDPMHLEQLEQARDLGDKKRRAAIDDVTDVLNRQLARADYFVCASEKQRDFWVGQLASQGRINKNNSDGDESFETLIGVCPFGLDEEHPKQTRHAIRGVVPGIGMDDEIILWGGGVYNWFDPLSLIRAVGRLSEAHPKVRLYFMGMKHPNPGVPEMRVAQEAVRLAAELGLTDRFVFFNHEWVPYEDRQNYLMDADVGVSTHFEHVETAYSFRTRILDYLWAGLPIVATRGDSFGNILDEEGIGISVAPSDVDGLVDALEAVLYDSELNRRIRDNVEVFAQRFRWNDVLQPLLEFCRRPRRAADVRYTSSDKMPARSVGFVQPGFDVVRDVKLAGKYLRTGGVTVLAGKVTQRFGRYMSAAAEGKRDGRTRR